MGILTYCGEMENAIGLLLGIFLFLGIGLGYSYAKIREQERKRLKIGGRNGSK